MGEFACVSCNTDTPTACCHRPSKSQRTDTGRAESPKSPWDIGRVQLGIDRGGFRMAECDQQAKQDRKSERIRGGTMRPRRASIAIAAIMLLAIVGCTPPPSGPFPVTVEAGFDFSCSIMSDQTVACWGDNQGGQLGNGTTTDSATPVPVTGLSDVSALAVGWSHACAVTTGGELWCWGANHAGQLGDGTVDTRLTPVEILVPAGAPTNSWVTAVTANFYNTCAWTSGTSAPASPRLFCWGQNLNGQLGSPHTDRLSPTVIYAGQDSYSNLQVGIGGDSICVLDSSHRSSQGTSPPSLQWCAGKNNVGQFGNSYPLGNYNVMQLVETFVDPDWPDGRYLDGGEGFGCRSNFDTGQLGCYGGAPFGNGSLGNPSSLVPVPGTWDARSFSSGWSSACGHRTSDDVYACWGRNQHGQLGDGTTVDRDAPVVVPVAPEEVSPHWSLHVIATGADHACALTPAAAGRHDVYCWGSNGSTAIRGTLGTTDVTQSSTPLRVPFD